MKNDRVKVLSGFKNVIKSKKALIGTSAGIGLVAKCQAYAGADFIVVDNPAKFRMGGHGSIGGFLAFSNSTNNLIQQVKEILPVSGSTPVFAGVTAQEPFESHTLIVKQLLEMGVAGVCNSPTVGFWDDFNAENFKKLGIGYDKEVDLIQYAHDQDIPTIAFCFNKKQAELMTQAGADIIIADLGLTTGGTVGAKTTYSREMSILKIQEIADTVHSIDFDRIVICHGGILSNPKIVRQILNELTNVVGFLGGSATDRIPMEESITEMARQFRLNRLY